MTKASDYKSRSQELIKAARKSAAEKLLQQHDRVSELWREAGSIPSGCGCTPFYSDARHAEELFRKEVLKFEQKYGKVELRKLPLLYGVER